MQENGIKSICERAMFHGIKLGIAMILANVFYIIGTKSPLFSGLFLCLFVAIPFIAGRIAIKYRKQERDNRITLTEAWIFLMVMFVCATILTAIAQLIYFIFIDGGYFMETMQNSFDVIINHENIDAVTKEQFATTAEVLKSLRPRDIVLQIMGTNFIFSPIITFIIAIFAAKPRK